MPDDTMTARGSCLCGAVRLGVAAGKQNIGACHCQMCRTWGGGPLLALESVTRVEIGDADLTHVFDFTARTLVLHLVTPT
ncbi:MAG: hypothetical protein U5L98_02545 [Halomonas sp.]|uniref:GFA family protein n=1 Tax=Halomonas sp. TaxID=1486246 RepID=UPI002ACD716A|nr:hypothetical protein [Halomonas sp.]MDZ7851544.1 hypothetical protein [Halomonas sp.]